MPRILGIGLLLIIVAGHLFPGGESGVIVQPVERTEAVEPAPTPSEPGVLETQRKALDSAKQIEKAMQDRADAVSKSIDEQTASADYVRRTPPRRD